MDFDLQMIDTGAARLQVNAALLEFLVTVRD
jgi:hypothetical protein